MPATQKQPVSFEITGPKGDRVASGRATVEDSVAGFQWDIPEWQAGGEYVLKVTSPQLGIALQVEATAYAVLAWLQDKAYVANVEKSLKWLAIHSELGKIDVPFAKVKSLAFRDDHEGISVALVNGDLLSGTHNLGKLRLKTAFGDVAVDAALIRRIACAQGRNGMFVREGLVLWNRLDSVEEVKRSAVGPGGALNGGRFVEGKFGKAIELNMQEELGVTFPVDALTTSVGCLEFWARISDFPARLTDGATPGLVGFGPAVPNEGFMLFFSANDGNANGGLCLRAGLAWIGTGNFGGWSYAHAIGGGDISEWHHYAVVWNAAGIPGVGDGTRKAAVYVDGALNSAHGFFGNGTRLLDLPSGSRFGFLNHQGLTSGRVVFDNLKVWNFAKTDFSDRNEE